MVLFICLSFAARKCILTRLRKQPESESFLGNQPIPNPPEGPLHVCDMKDGSVELSWNPPANDVGRRLNGYLVETLNLEETDRARIDETINPDVFKFKVCLLQEGRSYRFRILARYEGDNSEPLETSEPIRIKIAHSMYRVAQMETKERENRKVCGLTWLTNTVCVMCIEPAKIFAFSGMKPFDRFSKKGRYELMR